MGPHLADPPLPSAQDTAAGTTPQEATQETAVEGAVRADGRAKAILRGLGTAKGWPEWSEAQGLGPTLNGPVRLPAAPGAPGNRAGIGGKRPTKNKFDAEVVKWKWEGDANQARQDLERFFDPPVIALTQCSGRSRVTLATPPWAPLLGAIRAHHTSGLVAPPAELLRRGTTWKR